MLLYSMKVVKHSLNHGLFTDEEVDTGNHALAVRWRHRDVSQRGLVPTCSSHVSEVTKLISTVLMTS